MSLWSRPALFDPNKMVEKSDPAVFDYFPVLPVNDLPDGNRLFLQVEQKPIMVINLGGTLHAIGDICSHDHGPLGDGDVSIDTITCPRHGAHLTSALMALSLQRSNTDLPDRVVDGMSR
jgi:3-phenylpropionate/trans-cinnamate dioxygenase ferredoxin subunit